ncbi:MAG: methionine-R-sulfoxide reductase [Campylobacterota bacterium]|nr:methionine-R-sulfoxide reductase [Campylobacterota bacterium]
MSYNQLNEEEQRVILYKGTERAFSGEYFDYKEDGTYRCKQCDTPLFSSESKFDSGTGWPSFDDAIGDSVKELPDADGRRVEIVCAKCGGHLGHVFKGEGFTAKSTRHCVNSISLNFTKNNN